MTDTTTEDLARILKEHPFFKGMADAFCDLISDCATTEQFEAGRFVFHEGDPANHFYLLRHGKVALEIKAPERGSIVFQTVRAGEILGVSWLVPPYRWMFDAHATDVTRAIALDGKCLRNKSEQDHDLGYQLLKRFATVVQENLDAARLQILNIYEVHA